MMSRLLLEILLIACIAISKFHTLDIETEGLYTEASTYQCVECVVRFFRLLIFIYLFYMKFVHGVHKIKDKKE